MKEKKPNYAQHARKWGVNPPEVSDAKYIQEHRPEYINVLYDGGTIEYKDHKSGMLRKGTSLYPIRKSIEKSIKDVIEKGKFIENNGDINIARAFEQMRHAIKFLPNSLETKSIVYILKILTSELEETNYKETEEKIHT